MKTFFATVMGLTAMIALVGCQDEQLVAGAQPDFSLTASHENILEGETVTLTTQTSNTLGRNAEINWHVDGGQNVVTSADQRVAQVTFDQPGLHTVTANLVVNGNVTRTQSITVNVRPLRTTPGQQRQEIGGQSQQRQQGGQQNMGQQDQFGPQNQ